MGLFSKLFGGKKQVSLAEALNVECPHSVLVPRWETVQDMGIEEKASRYMCEACKEMYTPDEARHLRDTLHERIAAAEAAEKAEAERTGG